MDSIARRVDEARQRIAAACGRARRDPAQVRIVAASKTQPPEAIRAAVVAGVDAIGENRVQEAIGKRAEVDSTIPWHLIGPLQRNKAKAALDTFDLIQTLDRAALADRLELMLATADRTLPTLIEVNIGGETQKSGTAPADCPALIEHVLASCPHLLVGGLMVVPPWDPDPQHGRPYFAQLRELAQRLQAELSLAPLELSMGMSEDFEVAVEEGATWVRLGRTLFGERHTAG